MLGPWWQARKGVCHLRLEIRNLRLIKRDLTTRGVRFALKSGESAYRDGDVPLTRAIPRIKYRGDRVKSIVAVPEQFRRCTRKLLWRSDKYPLDC